MSVKEILQMILASNGNYSSDLFQKIPHEDYIANIGIIRKTLLDDGVWQQFDSAYCVN